MGPAVDVTYLRPLSSTYFHSILSLRSMLLLVLVLYSSSCHKSTIFYSSLNIWFLALRTFHRASGLLGPRSDSLQQSAAATQYDFSVPD